KYEKMAGKHEDVTTKLQTLANNHEALQQQFAQATSQLDELNRRLAASVMEKEATQRDLLQVGHALEARSQELLQTKCIVENSAKQLVNVQADRDQTLEKLDHSYRQVNQFVESGIGRIVVGLVTLYKICTLRAGRNTAFDDVVAMAARHTTGQSDPDSSSTPETVALERSRLSLLMDVLRYVWRNPFGSFRSFSLPRLRRALQIFVRSDDDDLQLWVRQRFPTLEEAQDRSNELDLDPSLDSLELDFPEVPQPLVSIILPVFNQYRMTVNCLRSILDHTHGLNYEVILADDCSTDLTETIGVRVSGLRLSRTTSNLGFLRNCNAAADQARGDYLLFLNNDTAVTPGWLSALLTAFADDLEVGIVGPKLLFGGGELQEAGGIIWDDGSGWNYGRLDDRNKPAYNYRRAVDYVSGACLMIRSPVWVELGGFDERYVPAYYEDTDLCFAARAAGYSVVYQPESEVYHFEGMSNGTDLESGIKHYQVQNQAKFVSRWAAELRDSHFPNGENVFQARDRSAGQLTVLVIDHYVPSYDKDAGSRSTMMYLRLMVDMGYRVIFLGANFFPHQPYTAELERLGIEVLYGEYMARHIQEWLGENAAKIGAIYLHRPHVAEQFLPMLKSLENCPKIIYFGHDLHYLRTEREATLYDDESLHAEAQSWKQREHAVFDQVDQIYYPSQSEVDEIHALRPELAVRTIPLYLVDGVEPVNYVPSERSGILFVGGFNHPPNADGVHWFVAEILPMIRAAEPDLELHIVGSNAPESILELAGVGVNVYGYLSDEELANMYSSVGVVVVPLRYGAGVKGKVIEALQWGLPVVTTEVGAEGIPDAEEVLWIGDKPDEFAAAVLSTYRAEEGSLDRLEEYPAYLQNYFSKARARSILIEDFGEPQCTVTTVSQRSV
ncbi:MAG: GT2 family glycosyltransferase, partial [Halieaceae bacterium]